MSKSPATILPQMKRQGPFTVEIAGPSIEGETKPRRSARQPDHLSTEYIKGVETLFSIVEYASNTYGDASAIATRKLINKHYETKSTKKFVDGKEQSVDKTWTYFELGGYDYTSFKEFRNLNHKIGAGLRALGLSSGDRVHIFAATSAHWMAIAHGAISQSMAIVTAYDTLGEDGLQHSLVSTKPKAVFIEPHLLGLLIKTLAAGNSVQNIIYNTDTMENLDDTDVRTLGERFPHVKLSSFEDLRILGEQNPISVTPPKPEDSCCIMFTSGSSGVPKGVELTHGNVVAAAAGALNFFGKLVSPEVSYLAYLPLAHIYEFVFEHAVLQYGGCLGYGSIRTLSQTNCRNCKGDIQEFQPALMVGVPAVWESIKKGILANVARQGKFARAVFWSAYSLKKHMLSYGVPGTSIIDAVVFNKIKAATGGRLRITTSGGAPIAKDTQEFISLTICPLINGYGLTETSAMGLIMHPLSWTTDSHGEPPPSIEIKLVDFPDAGYFSTNDKPQGEIWLRGPSVMRKYYDLPELTAEAFGPDQWFKTGDIGQWEKNGLLTIIDRKKNLVKTLNGEYIALEKLEAVYRSSIIVGNICICASVTETKPIAIIVPIEAKLKQLAESLDMYDHDLEVLLQDRRLKNEVLRSLILVGKKASLANIELIQGIVLSNEEWTPENNLVTPSNKLNRRAIAEKFSTEIDKAYGK